MTIIVLLRRLRAALAAMRWPLCPKCGIGRMAKLQYCIKYLPHCLSGEHIHQSCTVCGYELRLRCADKKGPARERAGLSRGGEVFICHPERRLPESRDQREAIDEAGR